MTTLYIQLDQALFSGSPDEFHVKVARTPEEIQALLEVGFEYTCEKKVRYSLGNASKLK